MSLLQIASSGLSAFQNALSVTGNNITNSKTKGYSRQSISFSPNATNSFGRFSVGNGVNVNSIYRNSNQFYNNQVQQTNSAKSQFETFFLQASQIDQLLSQNETSISASMQSFFDSLGQLNSAPDNSASRGVAFAQSKLLVNQFTSMQQKLDENQTNSTSQITQAVTQINLLTQNIADVNQKLMSQGDSPQLLDERDEYVKQLSEFVSVNTYSLGNGTIGVSTSSGQMLVSGTQQSTLSVDPDNAFGTKIMLGSSSGKVDITSELHSGMLGGLLDYEDDILAKTSQLIGQMAIGLAQTFNAQHQLGMDLNNQLGLNFFTDYNSVAQQLNRSIPARGNAGTGVLSVNISDISNTQISDYEMVVTDAATNEITMYRKSDGSATVLNWSSNPPAPPAGQFTLDGMTISVDNISNLADNDSFTITPTRGAARELALELTNANQIAMASPVSTSGALSNTGQGKIALGPVLNTNGVNKEYQINFISPTQFNLVNVTDNTSSGPFPFTPNTDNVVQIPDSTNPSYSITLSGIPETGDQFTAKYNAGGTGNNGNGLLLSSIQKDNIFAGGDNIFDKYADLITGIGSQTNQAKTSYLAADVLYESAVQFQQGVSGVNINDEAATLIQFEQAYEAAGKLMAVASQMMNVLFEMMR